MTIDITQLLAQVAPILIPYLAKGVEAYASESGKQLAQALYEKFKPKIKEKPIAQVAIQELIKNPTDEDTLLILQQQLKKILIEDANFAAEIYITIEEINTSNITTGDHSIAIQGNMKDSTAATGDNNIIAAHGGQINQTINNFIQYDRNSDQKILQDELINYLKWMSDYFEFIELRGIEQGESPVIRLKLEEVYIPLQIEAWYEPEETNEQVVQAKSQGVKVKAPNRNKNGQRIQLNQLFTNEKIRIIITGGPGCGKTTVLQHIAWNLAKGWLEDSKMAEINVGIKPPYPLPIYVPLNLYAKHLRDFANAPAKKRTLSGFISEYLVSNMVGPEINPDFFTFLLREKNAVILLLDGLDEVPTEDERIQVRNDIEKLISGKNHLHTVVTSRTAAYKGKAMLGHDFQHIRVLALETKQIGSMVRKAYNYRFVNSPTRAKKSADDLLDGIQRLENERQKRLGRNIERLIDSPLMVRMMLVVAANNRTLPNQRADLYDKTVHALLRPENILDEKVAEDISKRVGGSVSIHREMLQVLAFHMHQRGENQGKEIEEKALREILEPWPAYAPHVNDLLKLARARGGVLDFRGGTFRFLHLSFQEYLVGRYLAEQLRDIEKISQFLETDRVLDTWWREPILLLCGYLDINASSAARNLLQRLSGLDQNATVRDQTLSRDNLIASAEIAASALLEFQQAIPDLSVRLANRLANLLENKSPSETKLRVFAGDTLSKLGDPRKGVISDFLFCKTQLLNKSIGKNFYISRYPITNSQFSMFVDDPQGVTNQQWYTETGKELVKDDEFTEWYLIKRRGYLPNHPVVEITWHEAVAFTRWLTDKIRKERIKIKIWNNNEIDEPTIDFFQWEVRLPTGLEWKQAALGYQEALYPWGNAINTSQANYLETEIRSTSAVGMFPSGANEFGVLDLCGNVWELCASTDMKGYENYIKNEKGVFIENAPPVACGGAFNSNPLELSCTHRIRTDFFSSKMDRGFRIILAPL